MILPGNIAYNSRDSVIPYASPTSTFPIENTMASSSQPPVIPPTEGDKINFVLDIHVMRSLLHTIYSTDLIHRQPNKAQRSSYADKVSLLEQRITKIEEHLKKRKSLGRRLERFLTCRDRDYERFVALQSELNRVYSELMINAT
jgi:hypothetical protein